MTNAEKAPWEGYIPPNVQAPIPGAEQERVKVAKPAKGRKAAKRIVAAAQDDRLFDPGPPVEPETPAVDPDEQELREIAERARRYVRPPRRPYRARYQDSTDNSVRELKNE